jgi:hypothetical protein
MTPTKRLTPGQQQAEIDRLRKLAHDVCFVAAMLAAHLTDDAQRKIMLSEIAARRAEIDRPVAR